MNDTTLRLLGTLRGGSDPRDVTTFTAALEAFACLVLGGGDAESEAEVRASARAVAAHALAQRPPSASLARAHAFRVAFRATTRKVDGARMHGGPATLAVQGLFALPRPERVAVALSSIVGLRDEEVAHVLGVTPDVARAIVEEGVRLVRLEAEAVMRREREDVAAARASQREEAPADGSSRRSADGSAA